MQTIINITSATSIDNSFGQIVWGGSGIDKFIWVLIGISCIFTIYAIISACRKINRKPKTPFDPHAQMRNQLQQQGAQIEKLQEIAESQQEELKQLRQPLETK